MTLFDPATADDTLSVSQLTAMIRGRLERDFDNVRVEGEISNWRVAGSGHVYFALKDEGALLSAVMWRSTFERLRAEDFSDGTLVRASGRISVFDKRGQYQIIVGWMQHAGAGLLWQKFQEMKERLEKEGLFDPERKRPIPALPQSVGIITSPTGAAVRDMLNVLERRAPGLPVSIWPARVQGKGAAAELKRGVEKLSRSGLCDVIIIGRGGGSLEDLWEFNDEGLARAIAASPVPVISAVGHETDFSISDFVADLRAPTPSAAAELVSADRAAHCDRIRENARRIERAMDGQLREIRTRLRLATESYALRQPEARVHNAQQSVDDALRRMDTAVREGLNDAKARVREGTAALQGHNPELILRKGYAIVRGAKNNRVLTSAKVKPGTHIRTQFQDGVARSIVTDDAADLFE